MLNSSNKSKKKHLLVLFKKCHWLITHRIMVLGLCLVLAGVSITSCLFNVSSHEAHLLHPVQYVDFSLLDDLIVVAGHSIYVNDDYHAESMKSDDSWFLQSFQKNQGHAFVEHIQRGVELADANPKSLLIFSGGQTRQAAGPRSESQSYWLVAEFSEWWSRDSVRARALTEEYALDSYQNLLFSICRFYELAGRYPLSITMVGFDFKRARFQDVHRAALRFPADRFHYEGISVFKPTTTEAEKREVMEGEETQGLVPNRADMYGCGAFLSDKRATRNPFNRHHGYRESCPELKGLLTYCGPDFYSDPLPWTEL